MIPCYNAKLCGNARRVTRVTEQLLIFHLSNRLLIASVHRVIVIQNDIPTRAIQVRREIVPIVVLNLFSP